MSGWMVGSPPGKLHHLRVALRRHEVVQNPLNLGKRQIVALTRVGKAERARHVARGVDLDDAHADVLGVIGTKPAVVGTPSVNGCRVGLWDGAGLVEAGRRHILVRIPVDFPFEPAVVRTPLAQVHLVVSQQHLGIDDAPALGAEAARQFVKHFTGRRRGIRHPMTSLWHRGLVAGFAARGGSGGRAVRRLAYGLPSSSARRRYAAKAPTSGTTAWLYRCPPTKTAGGWRAPRRHASPTCVSQGFTTTASRGTWACRQASATAATVRSHSRHTQSGTETSP